MFSINLRGCQRTTCFLSPYHAQHRQNGIIFSMFLSNLRIKFLITKKVENNIFEGMAYRFYILLLFDFQNEQKKFVHFNYV